MYEKMFEDDFFIPDTREYLDCLGYYYDLILESAPAPELEPDECSRKKMSPQIEDPF